MTKSSKSKNRFAAFLLLKLGGKMIRIRSPTKKKLNSKSIAIGKVILPVAFFIEMKRRNF
ncbi:hypothetical protein IX293_001525 [Fusobacterium necrophorum]|nr:hypothetical protein [Fusobacterium necrophorum]